MDGLMFSLHQLRIQAYILPMLTNILICQSPTKEGHNTVALTTQEQKQ